MKVKNKEAMMINWNCGSGGVCIGLREGLLKEGMIGVMVDIFGGYKGQK